MTEPIAPLYGIQNILATIPEFVDGRFSGHFTGTPCFQEGKVRRLEEWLNQTGQNLDNSWFYSDSHNDLPLLERVDHPVAVDPDDHLDRVAREKNWRIISLREKGLV